MANFGDLPEVVLLELLSWLPAKDLIHNCRLVCIQWRDLVDSAILWKFKFKKETIGSVTTKSEVYYALSHLEKNLIQNPCGEEGLTHWEIQTPQEEMGKGHWEVEDVDGRGQTKLKTTDFLQKNLNVKDKPQHQVNKCFAAYNGLCIKSQLITLKDHGYWDELMDNSKPTIVVKDWFYWSPNAKYQLTTRLLSADMEVIQENSENEFKCTWKHSKWCNVSVSFFECSPGIRHILFQHQVESTDQFPEKERVRITKSSVTVGPYDGIENGYDYGCDVEYFYDSSDESDKDRCAISSDCSDDESYQFVSCIW